MYKKLIQEKRDQAIKVGVAINEIRQQYQGKEGDMSSLEVERFDAAVKDHDRLINEIQDLETKQRSIDSFDAFQNRVANDIPVLTNGEVRGNDARSLVDRAFDAFGDALRGGFGHVGNNRFDGAAFDRELNNFAVANPTKGGYAVVNQILAKRLIELVADATFIRQYATVETLTMAESLGVVLMGDLDDAEWTTEVANQTASTESPTGKRELNPKRLAKTIEVSKKLMRLSPNAIDAIMRRAQFVFARAQEKAFLLGTGNGQPLGIGVESVDGVSTSRTVTSASAGVVSPDEVWDVRAKLKEQYRPNAIWMMHRNMEARIRKFKVSGTNEYLWQPIGTQTVNGLTVGVGPTLAGMPYRLTEFMTDPGVSGSITSGIMALILSDLRAGYMIADVEGIEVIPMIEAYATKNQQGFAMNMEVDGAPTDENATARLKVQ